jgi:CheY-like chemotaxis protein
MQDSVREAAMIRAAWTTLLRSDPRRRDATAFGETRDRLAALERALTDCERERTRLAAMNDSRSAFILALLRELRAPLVDVLGHSRPSAADPPPPRAQEALREIEKAAAELTALIDDTTDFVVAGRSSSRGPMQRIDLRLAAQRTCDALARRAEASGVGLSCAPPAAGLIVMADPETLGGVLRGLLADAVRHAPRGGLVRIGVEREGDTVTLTLRGDGRPPAPTIPTDDGLDADGRLIPRLGFAAAQRLVEAIGGSLSSSGAALSLRLPAAGLGAAGRLAGAEVLVIGADLADLGLMRRVVTEKGGRLHAARTPQAGLPLAHDLDPDLLVLDLARAPERGLALKARLDADPLLFAKPVVALTCAVSQAERGRIDAAGFAARLSRPLDSAALGDALGEVLSATRRPVPLDADRPRGA